MVLIQLPQCRSSVHLRSVWVQLLEFGVQFQVNYNHLVNVLSRNPMDREKCSLKKRKISESRIIKKDYLFMKSLPSIPTMIDTRLMNPPTLRNISETLSLWLTTWKKNFIRKLKALLFIYLFTIEAILSQAVFFPFFFTSHALSAKHTIFMSTSLVIAKE